MSSTVEESKCLILEELMNHLKCDSKTGIIVCLSRLKCEPKSYKLFTKNGGLGILVNLLRYHNLKILNMTLSILANACMSSEAREKVNGSKIDINVVHIIKNQTLGNSLHCRACRLIGNLSECQSHGKALCDAGAVQALASLLQLNVNIQTYLMAVRAIRNIWFFYASCQEEMFELGVIKSIMLLLIFAKEKAGTEQKYLDLVNACLKAMCVFLERRHDPRCTQQMQGENAQGFKCIIECCSIHNKIAIKCLHYLSEIPEARLVLGSSGAVEILISLINTHPKLLQREIFYMLSYFSREAINRARLRIATGLEVMLMLLKKPEYVRYHPMLMQSLAEFVYDDLSIMIMVKHGLLDVLVAYLKKMVAECVRKEEKQVSMKRGNDSPPNRKSGFKYNKTDYGRFSLDYPRLDWSPSSTVSVSSSPPSTPPLPFYECTEMDENTEDNYSPVCSDTEYGDTEEERQEEVESLKSCISSIVGMEDETCYPMLSIDDDHASHYGNHFMLVLLSRLSYAKGPIAKLADPMTIEPLSTYIRHSKNPRAFRILIRIIRNAAYFIPLVKQGFVFEMQTFYGSEHYKKHLMRMAHTGGAIGELSLILHRGEEAHKMIIAVSIPYLINSSCTLRSLLINDGALQLIFHILKDDQHDLFEKAICSISHLALMRMQPEFGDKCQTAHGRLVDCQRDSETHPELSTVTFELDDGTTVDACRQTLCLKSDAFSAMLEGNFSESGKRRVKLKNTSKEGLTTLILAANGASLENRSIESLLDAVLLADKFLMADISDALTEKSILKLNYKNFSRAWTWAKNNSCNELKLCCVKTFLMAKMTTAERLQAFRDFLANEHFDEFLEEIKGLISAAL